MLPPARRRAFSALCLTGWVLALAGCGDGPRPAPYRSDVHGLAGGCFVIDAAAPGRSSGRLLRSSDSGAGFVFEAREVDAAARLALKPADLGTFLLRDADARYVVAGGKAGLERIQTLESDVTLNVDGYVSPAEWDVEAIASGPGRFLLRNRATGKYVGADGLEVDAGRAARIAFYPTTGCAEFPELSLDATGHLTKTHFADGDLFGIVDAHEHLFTNLGFGGGGVFHGAPFHRLGVEHALGSCEAFHGIDGRSDVIGYLYGSRKFDPAIALGVLLTGDVGEFDHYTEGYPEFLDWPNAWGTSTHQVMYYRWLERAWLGGLRLMVQHATSNQVLCDMAVAIDPAKSRISCNEMVSADRVIDATYALERYVDAHAGGPGKGWFRVVTTPADARRVIGEGKLAVVLGIETSNLFDCFLGGAPGFPPCDEEMVRHKLDSYHARGVRVLFPVHKFDNAFSAGDGHRGFVEIGNVGNTGHYSNFTDVGCPHEPSVFDKGPVTFGGLNQPRDEYDAPPPLDVSGLSTSPAGLMLQYRSELSKPPLTGDYCQNAGLQPLGETLVLEMMRRGMIIEIDHLPRRAYKRVFELLREHEYPAAGTHGNDNHGELYDLGGISVTGLPRCAGSNEQDVARHFRRRIERIVERGGYPAQGFGFDFNGFAGAPRPRFGTHARCSDPQENGITYPFASFAGDVDFEPPRLGNRTVDFDHEGMIHIGLMPELIQDARNMGISDEDLEPLFRSAEGYVRMWERAEARAAAFAGQALSR